MRIVDLSEGRQLAVNGFTKASTHVRVKLNASKENCLLMATVKSMASNDETFSPATCFPSIQMLLAYAVQKKMLVYQMAVV